MFKVLDGSQGKVLGVELSGGYTKDDVKELEKLFEAAAKNDNQVNFLIKVDQLKLTESEFAAMWEDGIYALKHLDQIGKIAVVGHSVFEKVLVKMDNMVFGSKKKGRIEKYFDVADLDRAWEFIKG